jgi:hypothetical protein
MSETIEGRRELIRTGALGAGALLLGNQRAWAGANDRVRVAVVGIHGMGQSHIRAYSELPNVEVAALCDVDESLFPEVIEKLFVKVGRRPPKTYTDLRKLYDDREIDAVSVVTPNHWHALAAIWAIQAGKHVSVEKPCCHNVFEGRKKILQFEVRGWITNAEDALWMRGKTDTPGYMATSAGNTIGNLFYGSKGYMVKDVDEWRTFMGEKREPGPTGRGEGNHYRAFVDAIRGADPATFNASIEEGFYSCALIHLANISYRLGRSLEFDPATLRFPRDEEANRMLTREYRAPFVVPDRV